MWNSIYYPELNVKIVERDSSRAVTKPPSIPDNSLSVADNDQRSMCETLPTSLVTAGTAWIREPVVGENDDLVKDLIPHQNWPGDDKVEEQCEGEMGIDYTNNRQLYYILQSAKKILNAEEGERERYRPWTSRHRTSLSPINLTKLRSSNKSKLSSITVPTEGSQVTTDTPRDAPMSPIKSEASPTHSKSLSTSKRHQRPKTTTCASLPSRMQKNAKHAPSIQKRQEMMMPYKQHKYKPPDVNKVPRKYWQPWNERGKIKKKDYSYLEIHYDDYKPESEDMRLKPKIFTHNHRHGYHWEIRHEIEKEEAQPNVEKTERIWENQFKIFQLDQMLDKRLSLK